jgi:hypothetical protein
MVNRNWGVQQKSSCMRGMTPRTDTQARQKLSLQRAEPNPAVSTPPRPPTVTTETSAIKFYYHPSQLRLQGRAVARRNRTVLRTGAGGYAQGRVAREAFTAINPITRKRRVLVDGDAVVFDSNAIPLYLRRRASSCRRTPEARTDAVPGWMFVATGSAGLYPTGGSLQALCPEPK